MDQPQHGKKEHSTPAEEFADLEALHWQIKHHEQQYKAQTQLSKFVSCIGSPFGVGDRASLEALRQLSSSIERAKDNQEKNDLFKRISQSIKADEDALKCELEFSRYGSGFAKTAALFMPGMAGKLAVITSYGLDQCRVGDSTRHQLIDACLGATKGVLLSATFSCLGSKVMNLSSATKGVLLGSVSRAVESIFERRSFESNGTFDLAAGMSKIGEQSMRPGLWLVDGATFAITHGVSHVVDRSTGGMVCRNKLLSGMLTGFSLGATSGALTEAQRQNMRLNEFDLWGIARRAIVQGATDSLAAIPGTIGSSFGSEGRAAQTHKAMTNYAGRPVKEFGQCYLRRENSLAGNYNLFEPGMPAGFTLSKPRVERLNFIVGVPTGTFKTYRDLILRGQLYVNREMNVFSIREHPGTKLIMPKSGCPGVSTLEACNLLAEIPDLRLVKRFVTLNDCHWLDPWLRQAGGGRSSVVGEAKVNGDLILFRPERSLDVRNTVMHEWSHLLRLRVPELGKLFDAVERIEPLRLVGQSALHGPDEPWAVLGEELLHRDSLMSALTIQHNPIRVAIWAEALGARLESLPCDRRSLNHARYEKLVEFIRKNTVNAAIEDLCRYLSPDSKTLVAQPIETLLMRGLYRQRLSGLAEAGVVQRS